MRKKFQYFVAGVAAAFGFIASIARPDGLETEPSVLSTADAPTTRPSTAPASSSPDAGADAPELMMFNDIPVVVAAGKREQTEDQAPASVSVIDANDIQLFNYDSLGQAMRNQRSFFLHTDGLNWMLGERGFIRADEWNARILVTVDGRPTNELIYGQSHLDEDFIVPMEAVKQIEVIRGPGSALYGTNAVFGVVNVVTKDGADVNGAQLRLEGGSKDTGRASLLYGQLVDGWDVLACFTGFTTQGDKDVVYDGVGDAAHDFGHIKNSDFGSAESAFVKARKGDLTVQFDTEARIQGNRAATYLASFSSPGSEHEQRTNFTVKYDHEIDAEKSVHAMVYYGHYGYQQSLAFAAALPTPAYTYTTIGNDDWVGAETHYDWQMTKAVHLLFGVDGRQSIFTHQHDYDTYHGSLLNIPASTDTWGIFTEGEDKVTDWLTLIAGGRVDDTQRIGFDVSPRFGAIVTPTKTDTVKVLYGRAFRTPNLYELLYTDPGSQIANPQLKPEICDTFELVWEREFENGWRATADGFMWRLKHAMEDFTYPDGALQVRNGSTIWAQGAEAEVSHKWSNGAEFRAYGTFTHAQRSGNRLTDSPEWVLGTAIVIPIYKNNTFLSIEPQFVGSMKDDLGDSIAPTYITNIVLTSRDIVPGWDVQAGVYNLFSDGARLARDGPFNQYQMNLDYPLPLYMVGVTHRF